MPTESNWQATPAARFFAALFGPEDRISFRPTETWTETGSNGKRLKKSRVIYKEARTVHFRTLFFVHRRLTEVCATERANYFFGVCPRYGSKHDKSWQIRLVRALWADIDNCRPAEAIERCKKAGVPLPSIVVNSGNGVHLYWLLAEPYSIDDVGDPPAVEVEWLDQGEGKKKRKQEWYRDEAGNRHDLPHDAPELSAKAMHFQDVLSGIASAIGGDKTHDLARLLRVPGTLNRKDERNGREPAPCELVEFHIDRRYPFGDFSKWADAAPSKKEREVIAAVPLPKPCKRISTTKQERLDELVTRCAIATVGERSERDWALICYAIRKGLPRQQVWQQVAGIGKFAERGEDYFLGRWVKAEQSVRQEKYEKSIRSAAPRNRQADNDQDAADDGQAASAGKMEIDAADQNLERITSNAWKAVAHRNSPPYLFRFGGAPARIERGDEESERGVPLIRLLDLDKLRYVVAREAIWFKEKEAGEQLIREDAMPPKDVVRDMLATPEPPLPVLRRIVESPVVAADGTVLNAPGYHPANKTLYCPADGFVVPPVPDQPSGEDLDYARNLVTEELLQDFPFVDDGDRAIAAAILLLPAARDLINGPTPLHLIEKPCHGTGATLLVDLLTYPSVGRAISIMTEARDEDEWRKRITAKLLSSPSIILIDNLRAQLDSAALWAALTAEFHEDRELRFSRMVRLPVRCLWIATGNNPAVSGEISRRVVACRLDANIDRPWLRDAKGFRHPDIKAWARANRGELVWASLTMIRAWVAAGKPRGGTTIGMYEEWSAVMGGILQVAGIPGFLAKQSLDRFYERADKDGESWRSFAGAWWSAHKDDARQVSELYALVGDIDLRLGDKNEQSRKIKLGKLLAQMEDRVYDIEQDGRQLHVRIKRGKELRRASTWMLEQVR